MNQPDFLVADFLVDGKISLLQKENEALAAEIEALAAENENMRRILNKLAPLADNKSAEKISAKFKSALSEAPKILKDGGGNK
ncbi:MAG: hypothetical protein LBO66_02350 [Deltaproteobacteria bacterium]|jgi:hypothetical protein|nr:hypothetical protein [Deltaproteobacteria bacterium]